MKRVHWSGDLKNVGARASSLGRITKEDFTLFPLGVTATLWGKYHPARSFRKRY